MNSPAFCLWLWNVFMQHTAWAGDQQDTGKRSLIPRWEVAACRLQVFHLKARCGCCFLFHYSLQYFGRTAALSAKSSQTHCILWTLNIESQLVTCHVIVVNEKLLPYNMFGLHRPDSVTWYCFLCWPTSLVVAAPSTSPTFSFSATLYSWFKYDLCSSKRD